MRRPAAFAFAIWLVSLCSPLAAAPVLDQVAMPSSLTAGYAIISSQSISQSFTVGLPGLLTGVDVSVYQDQGTTGDVTFQILSDPTNFGSSLFSTTIPLSAVPVGAGAFVGVDVSSAGIMVNPGDVLGIALSRVGGGLPPWVVWNAAVPYAGGTAYSTFLHASTGGDVAFRTYVDIAQVPEPAVLSLLALGLAGVARRRTRVY